MNTSASTPTVSTAPTSARSSSAPAPRPWWLELLLADFRHAVWPWLIYLVGCALFAMLPIFLASDDTPHAWAWVLIITAITVPAIVAGIFTADFDHSTLPALLAFPRQRSKIWWLRMALTAGLTVLPLLFAFLIADTRTEPIMYVFGMFAGIAVFCYITLGPLYAILFRKRLVAWSAILIAPMVVAIVALILEEAVGYKDDDAMARDFPFIPIFLIYTDLIAGIAATVAAWYVWKNLEVR